MATARYDDQTAPINWNGTLDHELADAENNSLPSTVNVNWHGWVNGHDGKDGFLFSEGRRDWDNVDGYGAGLPFCLRSSLDWRTDCYSEDWHLSGYPNYGLFHGILDLVIMINLVITYPATFNILMANYLTSRILTNYPSGYLRNQPVFNHAPGGPANQYTWNDVSFAIEIMDGVGTGRRRARQERLDKFDEKKKKQLIHLICRVKGEKVYDEKKLVGDVQIKLDDVDLVIERILGKMRVENTNVL